MHTAKQIANMIKANVKALDAKVITFRQFDQVQRATWDLVYQGELPVIGSLCARRAANVSKYLKLVAA